MKQTLVVIAASNPLGVQQKMANMSFIIESVPRVDHDITTKYAFLDRDGKPKQIHHSEKLAVELMTLHPVIRLRDSRRFPRPTHINGDSKTRVSKNASTTPVDVYWRCRVM